MFSEDIKARLYNCRVFLVSSNLDARNAFKDLVEKNGIKGFENFAALEQVQRRMEEYKGTNTEVHLLIIDIDGEYYNERLNFFNYVRKFPLTQKTPILILNKDWNNKQKKSLDDSECQEEGAGTGQDAWFTDSLTKFVNRPLDMNWVVDHMENLIDEAYPEGVCNFEIKKGENQYELIVPTVMDKVNFDELAQLLEEVVSESIQEMVFNFCRVENMGFQDLRLIFQMLFNTKKLGVVFQSVNVNEAVAQMMEQNGLLDSFNLKRPAPKSAGTTGVTSVNTKPKTPVKATEKYISINTNMVKPFIQASINCFNDYMDIQLQPQQPRMTENFVIPPMSSFATVIRLESPVFFGTIAQIYTKETFVKLCRLVALQCNTHDVKVIMSQINQLLDKVFSKAKEKLASDGIEIFEDEKDIKLVHSYESILKEMTNPTSIVIPINSKLGYISMIINGHSSL
ncbi:MAG: hypothetical protein A2381_07025 [Bdellovibrionales bacterium RIFOXYB1_FULL_37_110]|nr:MAG: hypothetical protein A2417_14900 [Bdellovibrionales bacterium RIFOXYC1_FULL_37_79]OFZ57814.1 MAG: hypothetical protein A2381_07025 [Bdellovibrionales bacterium RIFOXYB1_FULL_37_110]OFZ62780.1 MAG: hypothetical protein A2577_16545 [Bdellovibrionales bacterium RIFOXYD1_FULL_36_51]